MIFAPGMQDLITTGEHLTMHWTSKFCSSKRGLSPSFYLHVKSIYCTPTLTLLYTMENTILLSIFFSLQGHKAISVCLLSVIMHFRIVNGRTDIISLPLPFTFSFPILQVDNMVGQNDNRQIVLGDPLLEYWKRSGKNFSTWVLKNFSAGVLKRNYQYFPLDYSQSIIISIKYGIATPLCTYII